MGGVVGDRVDPAERTEVADPHRPLPGRGAQHEVGAAELPVQRPHAVADDRPPPGLPQPAGLLQLLELERVVGVDDQRDVRLGQPRVQPEHVALDDDGARVGSQGAQGGAVDGPHRDVRLLELRRGQGGDGDRADPAGAGQGARQLQAADGGPRHPLDERLRGDEQDARTPSGGQPRRPSGSHR